MIFTNTLAGRMRELVPLFTIEQPSNKVIGFFAISIFRKLYFFRLPFMSWFHEQVYHTSKSTIIFWAIEQRDAHTL